MKNMMRRTVAFMLMACLLLSVMAPTAFAAETTDVTYSGGYYDFGTADNSTVYYGKAEDAVSATENGNATIVGHTSSTRTDYQVNSNALWFRKGGYVAVKLTGLADETATYTFDVRTYSSHGGYTDVYVFPGDATSFDLTGKTAVMQTANTANKNNIKDVEITAEQVVDNSIVVVFTATSGTYNNRLNYMRLTRKVTLTEDVNQNITVGANAVLDLNGKTVTGSVTCTGGQVIDSVGTGGVSGTFNAEGNDLLPLKDSTGVYRLFEYETKKTSVEGTTNNAYWFDVEFTNDAAYALLDGTLTIKLEWTGAEDGSGIGEKTVAAGNIVADWAAAESASTDDYGMFVQVVKASVPEDVTYVDVTPVFTSESGATVEFGKISITYNTEA